MSFREVKIVLSLCSIVLMSACSNNGEMNAVTNDCPTDWQSALNAHGEAGFSGTVVYAEQGNVVCSVAYGIADRNTNRAITTDTVFSIGSITKTFTAAAILNLIDAGRFTLDDLAGSLLPTLSGPAANTSIRQLLSHTSGLQGSHSEDFVPMNTAEAIAAISTLSSASTPGTEYLYSNSGYSVLALIINELTGSYRDYITNEILLLPDGQRLGGFWSGLPQAQGPRAFGYSSDGSVSAQLGDFNGPHWAFDGNGGMAMTSEDLATWTQALADGEIIAPEAVETMTSVVWNHEPGVGDALGWVIVDQPFYEQRVANTAGSSNITKHEVSLAWQPETGRILVVATNTNEGPFIGEDETVDVFNAGGPIAAPQTLSAEDLAFIESVSGSYSTGSARYIVGMLDNEMVIAADGAETITSLFPPGPLQEEFDTHNALVTAFFNGDTEAGRAEIAHLSDANGNPPQVTLLGAFIGETGIGAALEITARGQELLGIYRLDSNGNIREALVYLSPAPLEVMPLVPLKRDSNQWVPAISDWPIAPIAVSFNEDASITITGPVSTIQAFPE